MRRLLDDGLLKWPPCSDLPANPSLFSLVIPDYNRRYPVKSASRRAGVGRVSWVKARPGALGLGG
jgi:hypothetical protein